MDAHIPKDKLSGLYAQHCRALAAAIKVGAAHALSERGGDQECEPPVLSFEEGAACQQQPQWGVVETARDLRFYRAPSETRASPAEEVRRELGTATVDAPPRPRPFVTVFAYPRFPSQSSCGGAKPVAGVSR